MQCLMPLAGAAAETLYVDSNSYATIQEAIDAANHNDIIVVAPGTYNETINFNGKAITLQSVDGPEATAINGVGLGESVVKCVNGEGRDTIIEGFTINGGAGTPMGPDSETRGGGMYVEGSSPTVSNCIFAGNAAAGGGGMYNEASTPVLADCVFRRNHAVSGGGVSNSNSNPTLLNCTFVSNFADFAGAGMNNENSSPAVMNCTFIRNTTPIDGGGMINVSGSYPSVTGCTFMENTAMDGAGMGNFGGADPTVTNCTFINNVASRSGGGMFNNSSNPIVISCIFGGNTAGSTGGGMSNQYSSPVVTNCTFGGNSTDFISGGGMFNHIGSSPEVTNCILWGNAPDAFGGDGSPTVIFSNVEGGFPGEGNIDVDPIFADPENGDFHLSSNSPCINAGDGEALPEEVETDVDGEPRIVGGLIDMGALENQRAGIPTVSEWGMVVMTLLLLTAGQIVFREHGPQAATA